jgi:hypothetical protein
MSAWPNVYTCKTCKKMITTVHIDEGATPFMLNCLATKGCQGKAYSSFYQPPDDAPAPAFEWFMPPLADWPRYSRPMRQHFEQGGLDLRPIGGGSLFTKRADA